MTVSPTESLVVRSDMDGPEQRPTEKPGRGAGLMGNARRAVVAVSVAYLAEVVFRLVLAFARTGPVVVADEIGYLANARVLAGGMPIDLSTATYYYSGSSLFMVPAFWLTRDPFTCYHVVLAIQALVSACVLPLIYGLCREIGITRPQSLAAALVAATSVDAVFWSNYALSESLLAPLTVVWVWMTVRLIRRGRSKAGVVSSVLLGLTFGLLAASHSRGALLVAIGGVTVLACLRWAGWRNVLVCAVAGAASVGGAFWLNLVTMRANYPGRSLSSLNPMAGGTGVGGVALSDQLERALGQVWYGAAATGLLAVYGLFHVWHMGFSGRPALRAPRLMAAVLLTLGAGAVALGSGTAIAVGASTRQLSPDYLVYGRYISLCLPLAVAFGVVGLIQRANRMAWALRAATALVALLLCVVVRSATAGLDARLSPRPFPIPAVSAMAHFAAGNTQHLHEIRVTALAIAIFAVCCAVVAVRRVWARGTVVLLQTVAFGALTASAVSTIALSSDEAYYRNQADALSAKEIDHAGLIAWDEAISAGGTANIVARMKFAYFAQDAALLPFDSRTGDPPAGVESVAAAHGWDGRGDGYLPVESIPGTDIEIWRAAP